MTFDTRPYDTFYLADEDDVRELHQRNYYGDSGDPLIDGNGDEAVLFDIRRQALRMSYSDMDTSARSWSDDSSAASLSFRNEASTMSSSAFSYTVTTTTTLNDEDDYVDFDSSSRRTTTTVVPIRFDSGRHHDGNHTHSNRMRVTLQRIREIGSENDLLGLVEQEDDSLFGARDSLLLNQGLVEHLADEFKGEVDDDDGTEAVGAKRRHRRLIGKKVSEEDSQRNEVDADLDCEYSLRGIQVQLGSSIPSHWNSGLSSRSMALSSTNSSSSFVTTVEDLNWEDSFRGNWQRLFGTTRTRSLSSIVSSSTTPSSTNLGPRDDTLELDDSIRMNRQRMFPRTGAGSFLDCNNVSSTMLEISTRSSMLDDSTRASIIDGSTRSAAILEVSTRSSVLDESIRVEDAVQIPRRLSRPPSGFLAGRAWGSSTDYFDDSSILSLTSGTERMLLENLFMEDSVRIRRNQFLVGKGQM